MLHIDSKQSVRFLRLIDARARAFTFQTFKEKGDTASTAEPKVIHSNSLNELRREHAAGAGIYLTVNETDGSGRRRSENITRIRAIWSEDDDGYTGEFPLAPSLVVETSPEHFHRYWLIANDWPADEKGRADFAAVMERMVTSFGSDANAKDICRVLRVPGFWHRKADNGSVAPFMIRVLDDNGARYTREQILAAFPPVVREQKKPQTEWKPRDDDDKQTREALDYIDPDDRVIWRNVGMALKEHMGEAGRPLWDSWSQRSAKYDERDQDKTWKSFHRHDLKIGSLFHYARQSGWQPDRRSAHKANGKDKSTESKPKDSREIITEDAAALEFTARYYEQLRFDHDIGKWFKWTGSHWQLERTKLAFAWARELARELSNEQQSKKTCVASGTTKFASGVERFAQADRAFAVTADIWDTDRYLLGTPGGTVDLHSGTIRPAKADDFITKLTAVAPSDSAECSLWLKFLQEATRSDNDLISYLQAFCGLMLTGDIREHALLFVYGPGGNGKNVWLDTVSGILHDYAKTAAMETFTASITDRHPTDLAMLRGARMVCASETEEGRAWAESRIKALTGGDKISARFMRQDFFEFSPQFKLVIIGNHKPTLRNVDEAARRRFNIAPFTYKPDSPDKELKDKLRQEWPGILRWMIEGCLRWQRDGLIRPKVVIEATEEYFSEQDSVRQWIEECCETSERTYSATSAELFKSWSAYALAIGEKPGTRKWFSQSLMRLGYRPTRDRQHGRGFAGIRVKIEVSFHEAASERDWP